MVNSARGPLEMLIWWPSQLQAALEKRAADPITEQPHRAPDPPAPCIIGGQVQLSWETPCMVRSNTATLSLCLAPPSPSLSRVLLIQQVRDYYHFALVPLTIKHLISKSVSLTQ